jgi:hypothetical protein
MNVKQIKYLLFPLLLMLSCNNEEVIIQKASKYISDNGNNYLKVFEYCRENNLDSISVENIENDSIKNIAKKLELNFIRIRKNKTENDTIFVAENDSVAIFISANQSFLLGDYFVYDFAKRERKLRANQFPKGGYYCYPILEKWYYVQIGFD